MKEIFFNHIFLHFHLCYPKYHVNVKPFKEKCTKNSNINKSQENEKQKQKLKKSNDQKQSTTIGQEERNERGTQLLNDRRGRKEETLTHTPCNKNEQQQQQ